MSGGILAGATIVGAVERGDIVIDPFDRDHINPASYDLTLGSQVVIYQRRLFFVDTWGPVHEAMDAKAEPKTIVTHVDPTEGFVLAPGILYLMHTAERIATTRYVPVLDGKSSIGRLGICVHLTAGYGDPGFDGQYTLEVTAVHPVRVYAGMRFAQIRFHTLVGTGPLYQGQYVGETARGPVPSRAWRQFAKKGVGA